MPNYGLVVTPTYNPMSYEQYIQPFKDYAQVYNETADKIDTLEMEANQWEKLAGNDKDAPQYQQYKQYADDLRGYADELASKGLNGRIRAGLSKMRQRYAKEIKPIEEAFNYRQKMADEQRKLNPKGDMQWTVDFSNIGLGQIMANPNLGYSSRSLDDVEKEAFEQAKSFSTRSITARKATELGSQYYQILQGVGQQAANAFLQRIREGRDANYSAKDLNELENLYNQVRESFGTTDAQSPFSTEQNAIADDRILNGIIKGLVLQDSYQTNHWAMPGANRGSGSGSDDGGLEHIGYEAVTKDAQGNVTGVYTVVDESGVVKYYKHNPNGTTSSVAMTPTEIKEAGLDKASVAPRYYTMPHNKNADLVYVVDANTGMKVAQDGKVVTYNRKNQRWNPLTKKVEDLPGVGKNKVPKAATTMRIVVSNTKGSRKKANQPGAMTNIKKADLPDNALPISYNDLTTDELMQLPDIVKLNPSVYEFRRTVEDAEYWGTGDNSVIYIVPTSSGSAVATENEEEGSNELE